MQLKLLNAKRTKVQLEVSVRGGMCFHFHLKAGGAEASLSSGGLLNSQSGQFQ